ncbi:MAG: hypothetical protein DHS20C10_11370 [marine bacterium B5-7]|nr:MAG: hypothetical protein DHS20C10_11370 [marine bacterium B5-7]
MQHAKRSFFWLILLTAIASTILLVREVKPVHQHDQALRDQIPDQFMWDVTATKFDEQGVRTSKLYSPHVIHYPKDDTSTLTTPKITIYRAPDPAWYIQAKHGTTRQGTTIIHLTDDVRIHQAAGKNNHETTLLTQALSFYPDRHFAETDKPVTMFQPGSYVNATGMQADFINNWVKLLSNARGDYAPTKH